VQGVGFRWFVENNASRIGVRGWVRNEDDGRVQVYATGTRDQLQELAALLYQGPRMAEIRGVEEQEAPVQQLSSFRSE
jgi:acylphosphatase